MKKILAIAAAVLALCSCINEDGIVIKLPDEIAKQWTSEVYDDDGEVSEILLWDFVSNEGAVSFVYFDSLESLKTFPQYRSYKDYIFDVQCRKKGDIYTITISDGDNSKYYFADVKGTTCTVTGEDGYQWHLTWCPVTVSAIPVDY